jgi:hypothetical protein
MATLAGVSANISRQSIQPVYAKYPNAGYLLPCSFGLGQEREHALAGPPVADLARVMSIWKDHRPHRCHNGSVLTGPLRQRVAHSGRGGRAGRSSPGTGGATGVGDAGELRGTATVMEAGQDESAPGPRQPAR